MTDEALSGRRASGGDQRDTAEGERRRLPASSGKSGEDPAQSVELIKPAIERAFSRAGVSVPPPQQEKVALELAPLVQEVSFSGPLPPPGLLAQYEAATPGCARDIVDMAKLEQKHRHKWETRALWNDVFMQSGGLLLGWVLAVAAFGASLVLFLNGHTAEGGVFLAVPAVMLIRTFVEAHKKPPMPAPPVPRQRERKPDKRGRRG